MHARAHGRCNGMIAIDCAFLPSNAFLPDEQVGDKAPDFTLKTAVSWMALGWLPLSNTHRSMTARSRLAAQLAPSLRRMASR